VVNPGVFTGLFLTWGKPGVCIRGEGLGGCGHVAQLDVSERRVGRGVINPDMSVGPLGFGAIWGPCMRVCGGGLRGCAHVACSVLGQLLGKEGEV
jgi:hypothetical protein